MPINFSKGLILVDGEILVAPATDGVAGQALVTNGIGQLAFGDFGTGDVSKAGAPADNQIAVWSDGGTIEGATLFVWTGSLAGIGTASPAAVLEINAATASNTGLIVQSTDDSTIKPLAIFQDSAGATRFEFKANGECGIGTSALSGKAINVSGSVKVSGSVEIYNTIYVTASKWYLSIGGGALLTIDSAALRLPYSDLVFKEKASYSSTVVAGDGYLWVKNDTPNSLMYTNDAGTDFKLAGHTHSAIGGESVTGYITITDASGTPRKLAVVS